VTAWCDGGYTTNLPLADLTGGAPGSPTATRASRSSPSTAAPARLLVPHLYFWKSAKWVRGLRLTVDRRAGLLGGRGYHNRGDPWREQRYWND
jgi:DMSO/TMAO reductase YedYZ molybdopterin-dependent catalytic subunit